MEGRGDTGDTENETAAILSEMRTKTKKTSFPIRTRMPLAHGADRKWQATFWLFAITYKIRTVDEGVGMVTSDNRLNRYGR